MRAKLGLLRRVLCRRRVAEARTWQRAEHAQAAEYNAAVRRLLDRAATLPAEQQPAQQ